MIVTQPADELSGPEARKGNFYVWYVVGILVLANAIAFMDRQILTLLVDPIRATLQISDFELSLLHGLAFAIFYTTLGVPLGKVADKHNRVRMMALGIIAWSIMTSACGLARSFAHLFVTRIGVGAGEAVLAPAAYSLLSDTFSPRQLPRALSIYMSGVYLGSGVAAITSGILIAIVPAVDLYPLGHFEPWQVIFLMLGVPGLLVAAVVATLREPTRRGVNKKMGEAGFRELIGFLNNKRGPLGLFVFGSALSALIWNAVSAWLPTLFIRNHGWTAPEVGLWFGIALLTSGAGGVVIGGMISGRMRGAGRLDANILVGFFSVILAMPFGIAGALVADGTVAMALFFVFTLFACLPFGCAPSALQEITPNQLRGRVSALYVLLANLAGSVAGPSIVAFQSDFVFGRDTALPYSLAATIAFVAPIAAMFLWIGASHYRREMERILAGDKEIGD